MDALERSENQEATFNPTSNYSDYAGKTTRIIGIGSIPCNI